MRATGTVDVQVTPMAIRGYITSKVSPLTAEDRCDRCGAQAWVQVELRDSDLLFCHHHFSQYKAELMDAATWIRDFTGAINP